MPALLVGVAKVDGGIETGEEGGVEVLAAVGGSNDDALGLRPKPVHLPQQHPQQPPRRLVHLRAASPTPHNHQPLVCFPLKPRAPEAV